MFGTNRIPYYGGLFDSIGRSGGIACMYHAGPGALTEGLGSRYYCDYCYPHITSDSPWTGVNYGYGFSGHITWSANTRADGTDGRPGIFDTVFDPPLSSADEFRGVKMIRGSRSSVIMLFICGLQIKSNIVR